MLQMAILPWMLFTSLASAKNLISCKTTKIILIILFVLYLQVGILGLHHPVLKNFKEQDAQTKATVIIFIVNCVVAPLYLIGALIYS